MYENQCVPYSSIRWWNKTNSELSRKTTITVFVFSSEFNVLVRYSTQKRSTTYVFSTRMFNVYIYFRLAWNIRIRFHMTSPLFNVLRESIKNVRLLFTVSEDKPPFYRYCTWISSKVFKTDNFCITSWDISLRQIQLHPNKASFSLYIYIYKQLEFQWIFIFDPWTLLKPDFISDVVVTC